MGFAENLKQLRKEKQLSQEQLAEILNVSRQAVSKWEQGLGYPETETLLRLAAQLDVSLDLLMSTGHAVPRKEESSSARQELIITSPHENVIATCYKVVSSGKIPGGIHSPKYALYGISRGVPSFWGEPTTFLGWYASKELLCQEIEEIQAAIARHASMYTLRYSARTQRRWLRIRILPE